MVGICDPVGADLESNWGGPLDGLPGPRCAHLAIHGMEQVFFCSAGSPKFGVVTQWSMEEIPPPCPKCTTRPLCPACPSVDADAGGGAPPRRPRPAVHRAHLPLPQAPCLRGARPARAISLGKPCRPSTAPASDLQDPSRLDGATPHHNHPQPPAATPRAREDGTLQAWAVAIGES